MDRNRHAPEAKSIAGTEEIGIELTDGQPGSAAVEQREGLIGSGRIGDDGSLQGTCMTLLERYPAGSSSSSGALLNMLNAIVGAGIIGLPFALSQSGLWMGVFMMCLSAFLSTRSSNMLISAGETVGRLNYEELMEEVFGTAGIHAFCFFAGVLSFGAMCAYLIIVGDTVTMVAVALGIKAAKFAQRWWSIGIFGTLFVLPVSVVKDLSKLSSASFISITADILLVLIVLFAAPGEARGRARVDTSDTFCIVRPTFLAGLGTMCFAFGGQVSSFLVYRSMAKRGTSSWAFVVKGAISAALIMGLILGISGYLSFANTTDANILNNFSTDSQAANVGRAFLAVTMVLTYPMAMYVARHAIDVSVFQYMLRAGPTTSSRHYALTLALWAVTMIISLLTEDLGFVFELCGALSGSTMSYTMPALLYINADRAQLRRVITLWSRASPEYEPIFLERLRASRILLVPVLNIIFGLVAMTAGVSTVFIERYRT